MKGIVHPTMADVEVLGEVRRAARSTNHQAPDRPTRPEALLLLRTVGRLKQKP
jgi:hypothetical protein